MSQKIGAIRRAAKLDPNYAEAFNSRGNLRKKMGEVRAALDGFDRALELNPRFADALNNRRRVRHINGDLKGAASDYDRAIELKPQYLTRCPAFKGIELFKSAHII